MENLQAFSILGIEATKDDKVIKSAYRMGLASNNPEENPEGFKLLREAYEVALEYAAKEDESDDIIEDGTVIGSFKKALNELYMDFESRMTLSKWEELLKHEVFDDLEYSDEAKWVLFSYLSEYFRVKFEVYRLLNDRFSIIENQKEFKEKLPEGFVDYIIRSINDVEDNNEFSYKWIKGSKNANYDKYISDLIEFYERLERKDYETIDDLDSLVASIDMSSVWHPYHEVYKAKYLFEKGLVDEAKDMAKAFLDMPECEESVRSHTIALEVLFDAGEEEFAKDGLLKLTEEVKGLYSAEKCLMRYFNKKEEYFEALKHFNNAMNYYGNQELAEEGKLIGGKFVEQCREKIKTEKLEKEVANQFAYSLLHIDQREECIEFLKNNEESYEDMEDYHKILAACYAGIITTSDCLEMMPSVFEEVDKYIKVQESFVIENDSDIKINDDEIDVTDKTPEEIEEEKKKKLEEKKNKSIDAKYEIAWSISLKARMYHVEYRSYVNDDNAEEREKRWKARENAYNLYIEADKVIENNINIKRNIISFATDVNMQQVAYDYCTEYLKEHPNEYSAMYELQRACVELNRGQEVIDLHFRLNEMYDKDPYVYTRAIVTFLYHYQINDAKEVLNRAKEAGVECFLLDVLEAEIEFEEIIYEEGHTTEQLEAVVARFDDIVNDVENVIDKVIAERNRESLDSLLKEKIYATAEIFYMKARILVDSNAEFKEIQEMLKKAIIIHDRRKYHMLLASMADECDQAVIATDNLHFIGKEYGYDISIYGKLAHAAAIMPFEIGGDKVFEYIDKALECGADTNYAYRMFAETYYRYSWDKKDYTYLRDSSNYWEKVYQMTPEDTAEAAYYIARNMNMLADYENAYKYAKMSDDAQPTESAKRMMANALRGLGRLKEAIGLYRFLEANTEDRYKKYNYKLKIAEMHASMGDYDAAVQGYDECLSIYRDKVYQTKIIEHCFYFGKFEDARRLAKKYLNVFVYAEDIYEGYSYFYEAKDNNTLNKAEKIAKEVIIKCDKDNCDCEEHDLARAMAEQLLADIMIYKRGDVLGGIKKKYKASRVIRQSRLDGWSQEKNMKRVDELMLLAYETCDSHQFFTYQDDIKWRIVNYSNGEYFDKKVIDAYTLNADSEFNGTYTDLCYVIKFLCSEGRFDEAEELIRTRLMRQETLCFISKAEADSLRLETIGTYFYMKGEKEKAMQYFREENTLYGMSKFAMLVLYGRANNKYDAIMSNGKSCFSDSKIKMIRTKVNISDEKSYIELVYVRPNLPAETKHYLVHRKYHKSQLIIPLAQGELLRMLSNNYQYKGQYVITDPAKLEYLKNLLTEQAILQEELNMLKDFNKFIRKEIAAILRGNNDENEVVRDIPILETYYQGKNCYSRYGIKYGFVEYSRLNEVMERIAYHVVSLYDHNLQGNEEEIKKFEEYV